MKSFNVHTIPNTDILTAKLGISMYMEIDDDCLCDGFPLIKMNDMFTTKSWIPKDHMELPATIETIGNSLHQRLMNIIPTTNTDMVEIISPNKQDRDGYGVVYTILRQTYQFMQPAPEGWGPDWLKGMSSSKYVKLLQNFAT